MLWPAAAAAGSRQPPAVLAHPALVVDLGARVVRRGFGLVGLAQLPLLALDIGLVLGLQGADALQGVVDALLGLAEVLAQALDVVPQLVVLVVAHAWPPSAIRSIASRAYCRSSNSQSCPANTARISPRRRVSSAASGATAMRSTTAASSPSMICARASATARARWPSA